MQRPKHASFFRVFASPDLSQHRLGETGLHEDLYDLCAVHEAVAVHVGLLKEFIKPFSVGNRNHPIHSRLRGVTTQSYINRQCGLVWAAMVKEAFEEMYLQVLTHSSAFVTTSSFNLRKSLNHFEEYVILGCSNAWSRRHISGNMHAWAGRFQENLFLWLPAPVPGEGDALWKCTQPSTMWQNESGR